MRALFLAAFLCGPTNAWAGTLTVGSGQTYATLADALAVAVDGDVLQLAPGTHTVSVPLIVNHGVTLSGGAGVEIQSTLTTGTMFSVSGKTLDAHDLLIRPGTRGVFNVAGSSAALHLTDVDVVGTGSASLASGVFVATSGGAVVSVTGGTVESVIGAANGNGGSISVGSGAHVTLSGVTFRNNRGYNGGVIGVIGASLTVADCTFENNTSTTLGGAIYAYSISSSYPMTITDTLFDGNVAPAGGAINAKYLTALSFKDNTFFDNRATSAGVISDVQGGAIYLGFSPDDTNVREIEGNVFRNNDSDYEGGAARIYSSGTVEFRNNVICGGDTQYGGGVAVYNTPVEFTNNVLDGNNASISGGGLFCTGASTGMTVANNAFLGNSSVQGGQAHLGACDMSFRSNILMSGTGTSSVDGTVAGEDYNLWWSNAGAVSVVSRGSHAVNLNPLLVRWTDDGDCTNDAIRPAYGSPTKDVGYSAASDLDGTRADIGPWGGINAAPYLWADGDSDGSPFVYDCAPTDDTIFPRAPETCDLRDEDCDGRVDLPVPVSAPRWYQDTDGDGVGDTGHSTSACTAPSGWVAASGDCDDHDVTVFPGAGERCDGHDNDCDGLVDAADDPADFPNWYTDADHDGFGAIGNPRQSCEPVPDRVEQAGDCDDGDASRNPDMAEWCDGVDQDCDGVVDDDPINPTDFYLDVDRDGFGSLLSGTMSGCIAAPGYVDNDLDCDDHDGATYPLAPESCTGPVVDHNCDGLTGDVDHDGDGVVACGDCNDANSQVFPGAPDTPYDGVVTDCDSVSDYDADRDGHVAIDYGGDDCDDQQATTFPGAVDVPGDGIDNDCAGGDAVAEPEDTDIELVGPTCGGCSTGTAPGGLWAVAAIVLWRRKRAA